MRNLRTKTTLFAVVLPLLLAGTARASADIKAVKFTPVASSDPFSIGPLPQRGNIQIVFTGLRPGEKLTEERTSRLEATIPTSAAKIRISQTSETAGPDLIQKLKSGQSLQVHIRRMRAKLNAGPVPPPALIAVRGFGYRLVWEGRQQESPGSSRG